MTALDADSIIGAMAETGTTKPGWYDDPQDPSGWRWWDGNEWTDRRSAKGSTTAPPPPGAPAPVKKKTHGCLISAGVAAAILLIIVILLAVATSKSSTPGQGSSSHPASADVTITCGNPDQFGLITGAVTIVNHSSQTSNYSVEVEWDDKTGARVATGADIENNVAPGQTVHGTAGGSVSSGGVPATCKVVSVDRFASR